MTVTSVGAQRVVVLDDDPTGTQAVSDLPVVLTPDRQTLEQIARRWDGPLWVLTNTRALNERDAVALLATIVADLHAVLGTDIRVVLRGDSTLRGHVLAEIDALSAPGSVALFVPAFLEQGRVTLDGIHYTLLDGRRVPVADTEYAQDATFGYHSSDLVTWIRDRDAARPAVSVPLRELREGGSVGLSRTLSTAPAGTVILPDAETADDMRIIHAAWNAALDGGRRVVLRCGSTLASVVVASGPKDVRLPAVAGSVLVVCASHTSGASAQLSELLEQQDIYALEIDVAALLDDPVSASKRVGVMAVEVDAALDTSRVVVLSTPRRVGARSADLETGAAVMDAVVGVVAGISRSPGAVVTKGGITSARVARDSFRANTATVLGQALPGVPVWELVLRNGTTLTHVVVPGNIGDPTTLAHLVNELTRAPRQAADASMSREARS